MPFRDDGLLIAAALVVSAVAGAVLHSGTSVRADESGPLAVEAGRRLLAENNCNGACHRIRSEDDDPLSFYRRPGRKVQSREELHKQVELCVSRLGSMIFAEEIGSVVSALDRDHYHFD